MKRRNEGPKGSLHQNGKSKEKRKKRALQVLMKTAPRWAIPLMKESSQPQPTSGIASNLKINKERIELSLVRSVAQSGLRRGGSLWGR